MDYVEIQLSDDPDNQAWTFDAIVKHRKSKNNKYEVLVHWRTGEETWEELNWIADQDPITIAKYAKEHKLLKMPG